MSLQQYLADQIPDIVEIDRFIITHEDADHCAGAGQFIRQWQNSGRKIQEVWLPAHWAVSANAPLQSGYERSRFVDEAFYFAEEICHKLNEHSIYERESILRESEVGIPESRFSEIIGSMCRQREVFDGLFEENVGPENLKIQNLDCLDEEIAQSTGDDLYRFGYPFRGRLEFPSTLLAMRIVNDVLDTHKNMASTIAACLHHCVKIRWFDFKAFSDHKWNEPSGGDADFLIPVNSREVTPTWKRLSYADIFLALSLTRANRESLVFYRPEEDDEPSVLFTADSKLKLGHRPFPTPRGMPGQHRLLATAMHHASATNNPGYKVLSSWLGSENYPPIYIKNGGVGVTKAAHCFTLANDRQCVRCIPDGNGNSLVRIDAPSGKWQIPAHPKACICQSH